MRIYWLGTFSAHCFHSLVAAHLYWDLDLADIALVEVDFRPIAAHRIAELVEEDHCQQREARTRRLSSTPIDT